MVKAKIYFYKEGNECLTLSGGWVVGRNTSAAGSQTKNADHIYIEAKGVSDNDRSFRTTNKIDTTKFSNIYVEWKNTGLNAASNETNISFATAENGFSWVDVLVIKTITGSFSKRITKVPIEISGDVTEGYLRLGAIFRHNASPSRSSQVYMYNVWLETIEDLIQISSQTKDNIEININDFGLLNIISVEVLINSILSETYVDDNSHINYSIDKSLLVPGCNKINIRVTYTQGDDIVEVLDEVLDYENIIPPLLPQNPMYDTIEKIKSINDIRKIEKSMLKDILTSKDIVVTEEDNIFDLINKIRELLGI